MNGPICQSFLPLTNEGLTRCCGIVLWELPAARDRVSPLTRLPLPPFQVDKLDASESLRKQEEQDTEAQPIVYGKTHPTF